MATRLLADKNRSVSTGPLIAHVNRIDIGGPTFAATFALTTGSMSVAMVSNTKPKRSAVCAVQLGNMGAAMQVTRTVYVPKNLLADRSRSTSSGNLQTHIVRGQAGLRINGLLENMSAALMVQRVIPARSSVVATTFESIGKIAGTMNAAQGFNAAAAIQLGDMTPALPMHFAPPNVFSIQMAPVLGDMAAALTAIYKQKSAAAFAMRLGDMQSALPVHVINTQYGAQLAAQLGDMAGNFAMQSLSPGFRFSFGIGLDSMSAAFSVGFAIVPRGVQIDAQLDDMRTHLFTQQGSVIGPWPGFSDWLGLKVRAKAKPLIVRGPKRAAPVTEGPP